MYKNVVRFDRNHGSIAEVFTENYGSCDTNFSDDRCLICYMRYFIN